MQVKVKILTSFNAVIDGTLRRLVRDETANMSAEAAEPFIRCAFLELIPDIPAVKIVNRQIEKGSKAVK